TAGDLDGEHFSRLSPFHQAPVIEDDGLVVAESAAIALYLAEKSGKLIPRDVEGRHRVIQWCLAAVSTVEPTLVCKDLIDIYDSQQVATTLHVEVRKLAGRWLGDLERRLEGCEWIAGDEFTAADVLLAGVLRTIRKTDLMHPFAKLSAYFTRCQMRPAWQKTLASCAERLGVSVDEIR